MKSLLKKAKQAYKNHFSGSGATPADDHEHADKASTKDANPNSEPGSQGFTACCDEENNGTNGHVVANGTATTTTTAPAATGESTSIKATTKSSKPSILSFGLSKNKEPANDKKIINNSTSNNPSPPKPSSSTPTEASEKKDDEKAPEREILYIKGLEDLPEDCMKLVKMSGLSEEKLKANLQVLLYVLHFRTGKIIKIEGEPPREPRKKFFSERFNDGDSLLVSVEHSQLKKLYKDVDQVGKGGFGTVYFSRSTKEKKTVAIKKMPHITKRQIAQNFREASILSKCNHPNIVKLITCHVDKDQNLWLIMEFMEGGTFEEAAKAWKFNENNLAYVARELLKGLQYLHENGMVHRDLKSANIMMSVEGKVKLIDFGLCEDVSTGSPCHMVGSPFWMAPEMILGKPHNTPVDIWSFAISLLEMANQRPPMMESAVKAMFTVATEGSTGFDEPDIWSDCFKEFLSLCLRLDPEERATAADLLKHPFIKKADTRDNMENILKKIFLTNSLMNSGF
ncbi:putative protein serine/threonine kinase [Heterostelium album PN500]|uniref:non-specific serine/threonine protein kinase n=1 Tax=Heterostelium pallidum (strain ATCC 26659 / Pp 5 / PN500) TaxID=670386 RepID=D3BEH0_HETP5|nr:putative protein serine/threonine kinase [Heterostelium album PN500]EFA80301.1 putative protein serine/threonine kinase [Heterostelium album PN500]|eukprot:XP_020432421.1 putative protein serine/threonine kinase [Heterostelium album PN500]